MICCVVLLNMNVLWLISCSDIDGHFQCRDVSNNIVRSSSPTPPCAQAGVSLRVDTKKWNCWVIGRGHFPISCPVALQRSVQVRTPEYESICSYPLQHPVQQTWQFLPVAFDLSCVYSDSLRLYWVQWILGICELNICGFNAARSHRVRDTV